MLANIQLSYVYRFIKSVRIQQKSMEFDWSSLFGKVYWVVYYFLKIGFHLMAEA